VKGRVKKKGLLDDEDIKMDFKSLDASFRDAEIFIDSILFCLDS